MFRHLLWPGMPGQIGSIVWPPRERGDRVLLLAGEGDRARRPLVAD